MWAIILSEIIKPKPHLWKTGIGYAVFTAFIGIPILFIVQEISVFKLIYSGTESDLLLFQIVGFVLGVGVCEEACKLIPVYFFGIKKNKINSLKDGMFLGIMSGLGFAMAEVVQYTIMYWQRGATASLAKQLVVIQIVRFLTLPLFHAAWAGIASWFCMIGSYKKTQKNLIIIVGILFTATLHGLYDVFSNKITGIVIGILTILILMAYKSHYENSYIEYSAEDNAKG